MIGINFCPFFCWIMTSLYFLNSLCCFAVCIPFIVVILLSYLKFFCLEGFSWASWASFQPLTTWLDIWVTIFHWAWIIGNFLTISMALFGEIISSLANFPLLIFNQNRIFVFDQMLVFHPLLFYRLSYINLNHSLINLQINADY